MKYYVALCALLLAATACAHTHLEKAVPADGAVLAQAPSELVLEFSKQARLTALTLQKEGARELIKPTGLPKDFATNLAVPLTSLVPGKYTVNWRVVGSDNHVMSGQLKFTIK